MSEELENISKINEIFIKEWISLNPNLKNIEFEDCPYIFYYDK